jgi:hypothetical protein
MALHFTLDSLCSLFSKVKLEVTIGISFRKKIFIFIRTQKTVKIYAHQQKAWLLLQTNAYMRLNI